MYDYGEILQVYGVSYFPTEYYWQVGQINKTQGWIIHLSVIKAQLQECLELIIPELLTQNLPFKIIRDAGYAFNLLEGSLGYTALGKLVSVYPEDDMQANYLAKSLLRLTNSFRGPSIPTDFHLGGIIYTRYGSFNPILMKNNKGEMVKHIYNASNQLIQDPYCIPFRFPDAIKWPFQDIATPEAAKIKRLLHYKYYPLLVLKPDAKGDVIRALYFRRPWQIKSCLLKQGRPNMFADDYGRDIQDRLKWQHELYQALNKDIPMPKIFEHFKENGNSYIAMEFIKGQTLTIWINSIYKDRCWRNLSSSDHGQLLEMLLNILVIIRRLHKKGYVHRDITPDNFLINKKKHIYLIDMELTWSGSIRPLQPPFQLGSPGHTSPEQMLAKTPNYKEDIYGIGSLMVVFFTNLYALKLNGQTSIQLQQSIQFFTGEPVLAQLISSCWNEAPSERPELEHIIDILKRFKEESNTRKNIESKENILDTSEITKVIQAGLNHLCSPQLLNPKSRWISISLKQELHIGNQQITINMYEGWHTGMAGPLWLVALAKKACFSIEACQLPYQRSWEYIEENYFSKPDRATLGLYSGNAGIALAILEGLNSGMLVPNPAILERLRECFSPSATQPGLAEGLSGQGIALLKCARWLDTNWVEKTLESYVYTLTECQQFDGSWNNYTGLDHGTAGILLFLLSYIRKYPNSDAKIPAEKALKWLENKRNNGKNGYSWKISTKIKIVDLWNVSIGIPGIALAFIKAYEIFKKSSYKEIAEHALLNIPVYPVRMDITLASGLVGLGEIYLEAFRAFKAPIWKERAAWIVRFLLNTFKTTSDNTGYWLTNINGITTADLFTGNGGPIHFLMRFVCSEERKPPSPF